MSTLIKTATKAHTSQHSGVWSRNYEVNSTLVIGPGERAEAAGGGTILAAVGGTIITAGRIIIIAAGGTIFVAGGGPIIAAGGGTGTDFAADGGDTDFAAGGWLAWETG